MRLAQRPAGLIILPGAGGGRDNRTLLALEAGLTPVDDDGGAAHPDAPPLRVVRAEFANRTAGKSGPERPAIAVAHVHTLVTQLAADLGVPTTQIVVGGRSFGGRMASIAVAEGLEVAGLLLLSYPLHPPGKPETLRIAHLAAITTPVLAVSGEKDPFGTPAELREHLAVIPAPVTYAFVPGNHAPADAPVVAAVGAWLGVVAEDGA